MRFSREKYKVSPASAIILATISSITILCVRGPSTSFTHRAYSEDARIFRSQKGQDAWVIDLFANLAKTHQSQRYYVDLAANDPYKISNSATLDSYGWRGLCIEGNPEYLQKFLESNRTCTLVNAVVSCKSGLTVEWVNDGPLGGIVAKQMDNKVSRQGSTFQKTETLHEILKKNTAPYKIDYLSLDVEGAEYNVLQNFPFDQYIFRTMTIERPSPKLNTLLKKNGYIWMKNAEYDSFYIHESLGIRAVSPFEQVAKKCTNEEGNGQPGSSCPWTAEDDEDNAECT